MVIDIMSLPYPIGEATIAEANESIGLILKQVYRAMNDKEQLEVEVLSDLIGWIRMNYSTLHPFEVKLAYDMFLGNHIRVEYMGTRLNKKNLANLLNSYNNYKERIRNVNKSKVEDKPKQKTPDELRAQHIEFLELILSVYEKYKKGDDISKSYMLGSTYEHFVRVELIDPEINEQFMEKAKSIYKTSQAMEYSRIPSDKEIQEQSVFVYRELCVLRAFEEIKFSDLDLRDYLMSRVK